MRHGKRRAAEMRESAATLDALGVSGGLASEIAEVQDKMGALPLWCLPQGQTEDGIREVVRLRTTLSEFKPLELSPAPGLDGLRVLYALAENLEPCDVYPVYFAPVRTVFRSCCGPVGNTHFRQIWPTDRRGFICVKISRFEFRKLASSTQNPNALRSMVSATRIRKTENIRFNGLGSLL
jgi:hypothetical protein